MQSNGTNTASNNKDKEKIVIGNGVQDGVNMAVDAGAGITYGKYLQVCKLLSVAVVCLHLIYKIWEMIVFIKLLLFFYSWTKS